MIHKLKYNGLKEAGHELGKIYASSLKCSEFLLDIDLIIPVPLHPSKLRKRGFNQSEIIAKGMSEASGIPYETDILEREQMSETQTKRSRYERWLNVEGIFRVSDGSLVDGKHILLIDDVITTGSTIEACVSALLAAGDVRVSVAALAVAVE
jgi:ComF family protein